MRSNSGGCHMALRTGGGDYLYEIVEEWGDMPDRWMYDVAGVAIDSKGNVYMFNRGETPVVVLDSCGKFLHSWGDKKMFPRAHGVTIGPDDNVAHRRLRSHGAQVHARGRSANDHRSERQTREGDERPALQSVHARCAQSAYRRHL